MSEKTIEKIQNLFGVVLTYAQPSSNYRGESEENRTVLQKISKNGKEYPIISSEAIRNALREMLASKIDEKQINRKRLHNEDQLAVEFKAFPNAEEYADDFLFGFLVADGNKYRPQGKSADELPAKRDSVLRMNLAVALSPYKYDATFHQSPLNAGDSPWKNAKSSMLLHKEIAATGFQFPFALAGSDCSKGKGKLWTKTLIEAIGEMTNVAGGHARHFYDMAPQSIVVRLTDSLAAGFNTYGFDENGNFPELTRITNEKDEEKVNVEENKGHHSHKDLSGDGFFVGGAIVRNMDPDFKAKLKEQNVRLYDSPQELLRDAAKAFLGV